MKLVREKLEYDFRVPEIFDQKPPQRNLYGIIILYLLHNGPCIPYQIAKTFNDAKEKGKWNVKQTATICNENKVASIMKEMHENHLILLKKDSELDTTRGQKWYDINPFILLSPRFIIKPTENTTNYINNILFGDGANEFKKKVSDKTPGAQRDLLDILILNRFIEIIQMCSTDELRVITKLSKFQSFDYLSVLVYCRDLIEYILAYLNAWWEWRSGIEMDEIKIKCMYPSKFEIVTMDEKRYEVSERMAYLINLKEEEELPIEIPIDFVKKYLGSYFSSDVDDVLDCHDVDNLFDRTEICLSEWVENIGFISALTDASEGVTQKINDYVRYQKGFFYDI